MIKGILVVILLIVLVLDWLALDDITTGNETSYFGEYAILAVSIFIIPVLYAQWKKLASDST